MSENLIDFMQQLDQQEPPPFTAPQVYYGPKEDALTFYIRSDESYAHRVNSLVTLFLSLEGDQLVGCQIKGLRRQLQQNGHFGVAIKREDGSGKIEVELGLFFHLLAFDISEPGPRHRLVELGQQAKGLKIDTEEPALH